jgi:hypothetical protein
MVVLTEPSARSEQAAQLEAASEAPAGHRTQLQRLQHALAGAVPERAFALRVEILSRPAESVVVPASARVVSQTAPSQSLHAVQNAHDSASGELQLAAASSASQPWAAAEAQRAASAYRTQQHTGERPDESGVRLRRLA